MVFLSISMVFLSISIVFLNISMDSLSISIDFHSISTESIRNLSGIYPETAQRIFGDLRRFP